MFSRFQRDVGENCSPRHGFHSWRNNSEAGHEHIVAFAPFGITIPPEWTQEEINVNFTASEFELGANHQFPNTQENFHHQPVFYATSIHNKKSTKKRLRTKFTAYQLLRLEEAFIENNYIIGMKRRRLAAELGLLEKPVKTWFQNRRVKMRVNQLKNHGVIPQ